MKNTWDEAERRSQVWCGSSSWAVDSLDGALGRTHVGLARDEKQGRREGESLKRLRDILCKEK